MSSVSVLSEWLLYIVGAVTAVISGFAKSIDDRSKQNKKDISKIQRQLRGDDTDPNTRGLFEIVHELDNKMECMDTKMDEIRRETKQDHRELMDKVEGLHSDD